MRMIHVQTRTAAYGQPHGGQPDGRWDGHLRDARLFLCGLAVAALFAVSWSDARAAAGTPAPAAPPPPQAAGQDIRILIDVSGSMKRNDPQNLRAPALKLITGLLPRGSRAGVWTFARYVNMLVPLGEVDEDWRRQALQASGQIHAHGLYTDIESTLAEATWDWSRPPDPAAPQQRTLILLTDGYVDVAPDPEANADSRRRILDQILPRLQKAAVVIHTIALGEDADAALLAQLATATGGRHVKATATDLERLFFRLFETSTMPETLPLEAGTVLVDESVEELTLLVFRDPEKDQPTRLTTPHGVQFDHRRLPPNVRWHHEERYDLVTIREPMTGTWRIEAATDPDNRVLVVSDLRVITTRLPENLSPEDRYTFLVQITNEGRVIQKKEFLHFVSVNVRQEQAGGRHWDWLLLDNGRRHDAAPGDGVYTLVLEDSLQPGRHTLVVDVDGTTFHRQLRQHFQVHTSPVETLVVERDGHAFLQVIPRAGLVEPDSMHVTATITSEDGARHSAAVPRAHHNLWQLPLDAYDPRQHHEIQVHIEGLRPDGRPLAASAGPLSYGAPAEAEEPEASITEVREEAPQEHAREAAAADAPAAGDVNWLWVTLEVLLINLLLGGGLYLAYRKCACLEVRLPRNWSQSPREGA